MNKAAIQYVQLVYFYRLLLVRQLVLFNLISLLAENSLEENPLIDENENKEKGRMEKLPCGQEMHRHHGDHIGSTNFITDAKGKVFEHVLYMPYGEEWISESHDDSLLPYRYTGKEKDFETGYVYYGARYLDSKFGTWISTDLALSDYIPNGAQLYFPDHAFDAYSLKGSGGVFNSINLNLYHYASLNPIKYVDPDGRSPWSKVAKLIIKGGDVAATFAGMVDDINTLTDSKSSTMDKVIAGVSLASELLPVSVGDIKDVAKFADKGLDKAKLLLKAGCSFTPETLVLTKEGLKPISEIREGDEVLAKDEKTGVETWKKVIAIFIEQHEEIIEVNVVNDKGEIEAIYTTAEHPFYIDRLGWVAASDLSNGYFIITDNGGKVKIQSLKNIVRAQEAYNLEVEDFHTYFVSKYGLWVHNSCLIKPSVANNKLSNLVEDLYKGAKGPNKIGSGSTADAIRNELKTGQPTHGKFHSQKGEEYVRALDNWLKKNPNASASDIDAAKALKQDLQNALNGN